MSKDEESQSNAWTVDEESQSNAWTVDKTRPWVELDKNLPKTVSRFSRAVL